MEILNKEKTYKSDSTFIYSCQYHVIFCTKYRRGVLVNNINDRLKELVLTKQTEFKYCVLDIEVMKDHIHLLLDVDPKVGIYNIVTKIKGYTSHALREEFPELKSRLPSLWTKSKFVASVGSVSLEVVKKYIEDQKGK